MKWMKQAARNLVAMAAALCLLLPCAVPASAESLQTPVWMQAWGGTRTAGVVGQLEQDRFTATIRVGEMNGTVELVRDNGKMYWKAEKLDGKAVEMTYCYDTNGALRYLITRIGGKQASMEYRSVSDKVDESLLEIPAGYTVCTKGEDGRLRDAAGNVVGE